LQQNRSTTEVALLNGKSVLPPEADIVGLLPHVRFVPTGVSPSNRIQL
jgi:hypothetical protein